MKTDTRNAMATSDVVESLLRRIRENLYPDNDSEFHKDRKRLVHAITWIANWMERRGLATSPKAYYTLISRQVADIVEHGQPERYAQYLPTYLLKCIQQHILHHGDELYDRLKRIRSYVEAIEVKTREKDQPADRNRRFIRDMQRLHHIANPKIRPKSDHKQMKLW